jgi:hypothetical protein
MTVEDSYLQKIAYSFAFIYNRNKEFLYELKGDEYYYDYYYLKVQTGRNLANRYKNIDSFDPAWKNHDKEIDTVLDLASLAYGGFFPLKLKRETMEQIRAAQNVVIYGAGKVGAGLLELLEERRVEVECFVTTTEPDTDTYRGKPVLKMSELSLNPKETIIVVAAAKDTDDMRAEALRCGYQNCISVYRWEAEWLGKPSEEEF